MRSKLEDIYEDYEIREAIMKMVSEDPATQRELGKAMDKKCFEKAQAKGQQTFTLVEQDLSAPRTICFWIMENIETAPVGKLIDALQDALAMRAASVRKHAD